jgi:type VI secretion system protein ImpA
MSSQGVRLAIDLERLLEPISVENPCGESLRYEGTYDRVEQSRREDNANLPQGLWKTDLKRADWLAVEAICAEALEKRTKDLQLAAWLLQAWIHLDGFTGAVRGFKLMNGLCQKFWDGLFPAIEGGDLEFRLAPIRWINEKLPLDLKLVPITKPFSEDVPTYSWADWETLLRAAGPAKEPSDNSMARFQQSLQMTARDWLVSLRRDVGEMISAGNAFDQLIDEKAGKLAPGTLRVRAVAEEVGQLLDSVLTETQSGTIVPVVAPEGPLEAEPVESATELSVSSQEKPTGAIRTRAEAYRLLEEAADFLQRTEPHSPTPYLVRRAVAWGKMSFNELLPELVRNNSELSEILRLLQVDATNRTKS